MQPNRAGRNHHLGVLSSGERKLKGRSFYLDSVKSRLAALLVESISNFGGVVEGFLHKDISCVVTGSQEWIKCPRGEAVREGMRGGEVSSSHLSKQPEGILIPSKGNHPSTPRPMVCGSRGKALLEKAIRNKDRLQGGSVLANARSWGVKIVHVDDFLSFVKLLKAECAKVKRPEQKNTKKCSATRIVKAIALKAPFLKVEDISRKYKPLHLQSMVFPTLYLHSSCFSPFTPPQPERSHNTARVRVSASEHPSQTPLLRTPSLSCAPQARRKNLGYCECCRDHFNDQAEHLQSEQHRRYVQDSSNYDVVEQLVVDMQPGFDPDPTQEPTASLMRSPDLEADTSSETEHTFQTLLIRGSPSWILAECPNHITRPATPCTPTDPPDPVPLSLCPDPLDQPSSPYSQPPPLSPQWLDPSDIAEPHSLYSEPPVLSPQVFHQPTEPDEDVVLLEQSDPGYQTLQVALHEPALPVYCSVHEVEGPGRDRLLVGDDRVTLEQALRTGSGGVGVCMSESLLQACCTKRNPRKSFRSESPDHSASKKRRTSPVRCPSSDPSQGFSTGWTIQEAKMSIPSTHEPVVKVTLEQVETDGTAFQEHSVEQFSGNAGRKTISHTQDGTQDGSDCSSQSTPTCGLANESCPTVVGHKITNSLQRAEFGTTDPTFLFPHVTNIPRISNQPVHSTFSNRNSSQDMCIKQQNLPDVPNSWFISPRSGTICPASSQNSQPSLSQSYSSVCIESALIPDLATPSSSNSDWDSGLVFQLDPVPAVLPSTGGRCGMDMEMLQRPCTWMHNTSYSSHLSSALQLPVSPPSLCGDETTPMSFSRTVMQSVEIQH